MKVTADQQAEAPTAHGHIRSFVLRRPGLERTTAYRADVDGPHRRPRGRRRST